MENGIGPAWGLPGGGPEPAGGNHPVSGSFPQVFHAARFEGGDPPARPVVGSGSGGSVEIPLGKTGLRD